MSRVTSTLAALFVCQVAFPQSTAIRAGRIINPEDGSVLTNQVILIEDKKITAIGSNVVIPPSAKVIDLSRSTVLPGLIDCHTHICLGPEKPESYLFGSVEMTGAFRALAAVKNCREYLEAGFTTIRDVGNAGSFVDTDVRKAVEQGIIPGPTIINAGRIIAPYGGQFQLQPERPELGEPEYIYADSHDEIVKAVRMNAHFGAKVIKIVIDDQPYIYSVEDVKLIVEEAKRMGLRVAAHCRYEPGAIVAIKAGVASIEHGPRMSDDTIKMAIEAGVVICGTEFPRSLFPGSVAGDDSVPSLFIERLNRSYRLGAVHAFGTDMTSWRMDGTRGQWALNWIDSYVEAGFKPMEILQAMTTNASRLLGIDSERGALKPGMFADIVAIETDPLDDIQALKHVSFVMKEGIVAKNTP